MAAVHRRFGEDLLWCVVAQELHQDGEKHLHIGLETKKKLNIVNKSDLDCLTGSHGNYQAMKNMIKTLEYLTKEDKTPLCHGINIQDVLLASRNHKSGKATLVAQQMKEGKSLKEIAEEFPGFYMMNRKKVEDYATYLEQQSSREKLKEWKALELNVKELPEGWFPELLEIVEWLKQNIRTPGRPLGEKHLYIQSPTAMGKSSLVNKLREYLSVYDIPQGEDFYDYYEDNVYDLAVLDEFKANKTVQWLNMWLQGFPMTIRKKGCQVIKKQNLPTIILSNFSVEECYSKKIYQQLEPLLRRLKVVSIDAPLFPIINLF